MVPQKRLSLLLICLATGWLAVIGKPIQAKAPKNSTTVTEDAAEDDSRMKKVKLEVAVADPLCLSDQRRTTFLKVGLTGFELPDEQTRAPVNIALVIDKSGSMQGDKINKAKQAAMAAIDRLRSDDIVSVVAYDQGIEVILPARKLTEKDEAKNAVRKITAGGSTALFAGVSKGAAEVRKFVADNRVNRVILLSDGRGNIGPDSPSELGDFGLSLLKENIAVTTMGLGLDYHEDLMTQLAVKSNGNHLFIENPNELIGVFQREFDDVLSVVAQEILIRLQFREGLRPVRVLGQAAEIHGQNVTVMLNQLYALQERFIVVEVDVPPTASDSTRSVAAINVTYANMQSKREDTCASSASITFSNDALKCEQSRNLDVLANRVLLEANERNQEATRLRDAGMVSQAYELLLKNSKFLNSNGLQLNSEILLQQGRENDSQALFIDDANWNKTRKLMKRGQAAVIQQSSGYGDLDGGGYGGGYPDAQRRFSIETPPNKAQAKPVQP